MIKTNIKLLVIILIGFSLISFVKKDKEKFIGEQRLKDCQIEIPLYYATKKQKELEAAAVKYKGIEIVLVTKQKKGKASYSFYYLVSYVASDGPSAYLVESKQYKSDSKNKSMLFLGYKPKKHTFYKADCFRKKLEEDVTLKENLEEK